MAPLTPPPNLAPELQGLLGQPTSQVLIILLASLSSWPLHLYLVGGVVRDQQLHRSGAGGCQAVQPVDLDLLLVPHHLEPPVLPLCRVLHHWQEALERGGWSLTTQVHGAFGTAHLVAQPSKSQAQHLHPPDHGHMNAPLAIDVAMARTEHYPIPGENPHVTLITGDDGVLVDLSRRDCSINAMAWLLPHGPLLDPYRGQQDLDHGLLRFLHHTSLRDDPTRIIRAARYGARLHLNLTPTALQQLHGTLHSWPWRREHPWPAALGSRLGMELDLLFQQEPWLEAITLLQYWGALELVDWSGALQRDQTWQRRLSWAERWNLPLLPALLMGAAEPLAVAERLQLPITQQRLMAQTIHLQAWLQS